MRKILLVILLFLCVETSLFASTPVSIHKDWTLFKTEIEGKEICYIASLPIKKEGNYKKRG